MNFFYSEFFSCNLCKIVDRKMDIFDGKIIDGNFSKINDDFVVER